MANDLRKEVLVVDGMPSTKACIKFTGDENYYDISQKVQGYDLVKYGIVKGATVDVTFDKANQVIYLKKKEGAAPATTEQTSAPTTTAGETETWTVKAVAKNKKVIKFIESSKDWDVVSPEVEALDLTALGIVPKATVLVTFDAKEVVTAISIAEGEESASTSTDTPPDTSTNNYSDATRISIEKQVCLKEAGDTVRSLIEMVRDETNTIVGIKEVLKDIMKACLEAMKL